MILMAYGGFRFSMDTFAYEQVTRKLSARLESQKVIGSRPSIHNLGLDDETISITATFFPFHLPGNAGLSQVARMRAAVGEAQPLLAFRQIFADYAGMWALKSFEEKKSEIHPTGEGQKIEVEIELLFDPDSNGGGLSSVFSLFN